MPITAEHHPETGELRICIEGRFDFAQHYAFRTLYEEFEKPVKSYVIDLSKTTYVDSSALGMILLLRDFAGGDKAQIRIQHVTEDVRDLLMVSNFNRLFSIEK